jgi:hypothetical protein
MASCAGRDENIAMKTPSKPFFARLANQEDWQAILIALLLIILSAAGLLGKNGLPISF